MEGLERLAGFGEDNLAARFLPACLGRTGGITVDVGISVVGTAELPRVPVANRIKSSLSYPIFAMPTQRRCRPAARKTRLRRTLVI